MVYDVTTKVRIRVTHRTATDAEHLALRLLENVLGDILEAPRVIETGILLSGDNPASEPVETDDRWTA